MVLLSLCEEKLRGLPNALEVCRILSNDPTLEDYTVTIKVLCFPYIGFFSMSYIRRGSDRGKLHGSNFDGIVNFTSSN